MNTENTETKKYRVLTQAEIDAYKFASTDQTRQILNGILVEKEQTVATDGRLLIHIPACKYLNESDLPMIPNSEGINGENPIIPVEVLKKVKPGKKAALPVLNNTVLSALPGISEDINSGKYQITTFDKDANQQTSVVKPIEGTFPNYKQVIPDRKGYKKTIRISAEILKKFAEFTLKHGEGVIPSITFSFAEEVAGNTNSGPEWNPAILDIETKDNSSVVGIAMPMRME